MKAGEGGVSSSIPPPNIKRSNGKANRMTRKVLSIKTPVEQGVKLDDVVQKACMNCRFFQNSETFPDSGECRRRPPFFHQGKEISAWPMVNELDWCGEFKRLPSQEA